eukprot:CAMPEP_0178999462 /NCGR_PEP_ID=MMETSP0795-20121207/10081_1 /TAXON_ID=88552 /ORGANISM="Amoebophrya sp., Strain Ameob2" /LENGTH=441 /DNA_ID=CAMNT_0020692253 /DNA_START=178 /DNA_END=1503 /DNA_ORIENTATION=+
MPLDLSTWKLDSFGEGNPFGDPSWYQGQYSPYYKESHKQLRNYVREMVEEHIAPYCHEWDEAKEIPKETLKKIGDSGIHALCVGHPYPVEHVNLPPCLKGKEDEIDSFHEFIVIDEFSRVGSGGVGWGINGGLCIGLPPVLRFGNKALRDKVCGPVLRGEKIICLAITEPTAGSDVANLRCKAEKQGDHYIVNGEKKWITNGIWADYFTVAVRTGGPGAGGVSMLLVERGPGVKTRRMDCSGVWCSGTTYITFDNVKVPCSNLLGKENKGFKYIVSNFNHERLLICYMSNRFARVCLEESIKFANKRKTFGKKLIEHPVIRWKIAEMSREVEATHSWLEQLCYNMDKMQKAEADLKLGGMTALAKVQCTKTMEYCAREAAQIFGGLSYSRGGQGEKVERLNREVRAMAVPGGSEEIMLDLGVKQAKKVAELGKTMAENSKM